MIDGDESVQQQERILKSLTSFASAHSELGRVFARSQRMHTTDAAAIVEIITAEERGHPMTPARLAKQIALTTGATSILLNRLEGAGHVIRTRGHSDRRVVTLHSTQTVHERADAFYAPLTRQLRSVVSDYSHADLALVEDLLNRVKSCMSSYAGGTSAPPAASEQAPD